MPNDINTFVKWVIDQRPESSKIPEAEKVIMQKDLESRLERMVNTALIAQMTPEQLEQFNDLTDQASDEQIQQFIERSVPHSQEVTTQVLTDFVKMYLGENYAGNSGRPA